MNIRTFLLTIIVLIAPLGAVADAGEFVGTLVSEAGSVTTKTADPGSFMLISPKTTIACTLAGIAILEAPRIASAVKSCIRKGWNVIKPTIAHTAEGVSKASGMLFVSLGMVGKLCSLGNIRVRLAGRLFDKNTFYSAAAAALPVSYFAYRVGRTLNEKPKQEEKKQKEPDATIQIVQLKS